MPERLVLLGLLVAVVVGGVLVVRLWNRRTSRAIKAGGPAWSSLGTEPDGRRTLIAFSTPSCAACHQAQAPAIDRARTAVGEESVRVIKIDAADQPHVARAFGILTVPSTVVVAATGGEIIAINQGFTPSTRLVQQLQ